MEQHQKNSLVVGLWLEKHPAVLSVIHPGLPSHPQHHIVLKQCYGHSGMISFYLKGKLAESRKLLSSLKVNLYSRHSFHVHSSAACSELSFLDQTSYALLIRFFYILFYLIFISGLYVSHISFLIHPRSFIFYNSFLFCSIPPRWFLFFIHRAYHSSI